MKTVFLPKVLNPSSEAKLNLDLQESPKETCSDGIPAEGQNSFHPQDQVKGS
jgi:hypothetical protein